MVLKSELPSERSIKQAVNEITHNSQARVQRVQFNWTI